MYTHGLNCDGGVESLQKQAQEANISLKETTVKVKHGYVGKPKGAAQIAAETGFIGLDGSLFIGRNYSMNVTSIKDPVRKWLQWIR